MFSSVRVVAASNSPNFRVSYRYMFVIMDIWKRLSQYGIFAPEIDDQVWHSIRKTSIHQRFRQKFLPEKEAEKTRIFPQTFFPRLAPSSSVGQQTQVSGKESEVRFARKKSSLFEKAALGPHFASGLLVWSFGRKRKRETLQLAQNTLCFPHFRHSF